MATAQAWNLDRLVAELETQLEIARSGGAKTVSAGNGALELIGRVTGILSDKAREAPMAPITRVVVVLDHGVAAGKERFTEAEGYKVLPQSKDETESEHVPPAGITKSVEEEI
jgi:nucleoid-associated protein YgaU